jgi:hypothetical protein
VERDKTLGEIVNSQLDQSPQQLQYPPYDTHNPLFYLLAKIVARVQQINTISNCIPAHTPGSTLRRIKNPPSPAMLSSHHITKESPVTHFTWTLVVMMKLMIFKIHIQRTERVGFCCIHIQLHLFEFQDVKNGGGVKNCN